MALILLRLLIRVRASLQCKNYAACSRAVRRDRAVRAIKYRVSADDLAARRIGNVINHALIKVVSGCLCGVASVIGKVFPF